MKDLNSVVFIFFFFLMKDLKLNLDPEENITAPKPNHMGFLYENWSH
jgi:hypothetical protein